MTNTKPKIRDNEIMEEGNVERFMIEALKKYSSLNRPNDVMFWREAVRIYGNKQYEQGKQAQFVETINLFNGLRNRRFQFNDDVKMTIDMLKDEMTRRLKSQLKEEVD